MERTAKGMVIPALHLNGSGEENLVRGWQDAAAAIRTAIGLLAQTAPHGRDFYVLPDGDDALRYSLTQHRARLTRLQDTYDELEELAVAINTESDRRKRS